MPTIHPAFRITAFTNTAATFLLLVSAIGCGDSLPSYEMVPVSGVVNLDGAPVANANLVFYSETLPRAFATTDNSGTFQLETPQYGEGIPEGSYLVQIQSSDQTIDSQSGKSVSIPIVYGENGIEVITISSDGEKTFTFDLKSRPKKGDYVSENSMAEA
ncbi:carboxypeptidase-like regulatory domain-containing protein [Rosistilla oblonga]|uniref:Carboxypeptidase regulatory-like domain-containing protein n=1 Tax=Rosistilla oblonga TaxID=2527990 RepID=A0A518IPV3_9BACT|nr:carboxypeptidase-like regulatory domain-containing protein [Rosistilla oblonga]QDV55102.1 hypothetical protein Mal33_10710 [Rosistilla oblonga]